MTVKPTRQQVVEALEKTGMEFYYNARGGNVVLIGAIADALVKAGLVEEPLARGTYTYSQLPHGDETQVAGCFRTAYFDGTDWWVPSEMARCAAKPFKIHPFEPPKE